MPSLYAEIMYQHQSDSTNTKNKLESKKHVIPSLAWGNELNIDISTWYIEPKSAQGLDGV